MTGWVWFAYHSVHWLGPILVAIGGALGAVARYCLSSAITAHRESLLPWGRSQLPWGTIGVNLIGSFIIGIIPAIIGSVETRIIGFPLAASNAWVALARLLFISGFCGGFTTFSTAMMDAISLARSGSWRVGLRSVYLTLLGSLAAVIAGSLVGAGLFF